MNEFEIENGVLKKYHGDGGDVVIPDGVTSIARSVFSGWKAIDSVVIPEGVTSIGNHAFNECKNMKSITIPDSVTEIGESAFQKCSSLTSIRIPEGVTVLREYLFFKCRKLTDISIPESVTDIGAQVFAFTPWLRKHPDKFVIVNQVLVKYKGRRKNAVIPDGVRKIGAQAFLSCNTIEKIVIPEGVTSIGYAAFGSCHSAREISIPASVTDIGGWAFGDTPWLNNYPSDFVTVNHILIRYKGKDPSVVIPDDVTHIAEFAFYDCRAIHDVTIPETVNYVHADALYYCPRLESMHYHGITITSSDMISQVNMRNLFDMIDKKDFSLKLISPVKYHIIWSIFSANPEDADALAYIKKSFVRMFRFLIDKNQVETVQKVLDATDFVTKKNIDTLILYAIDKQKTEIQLMLVNYKETHIGYEDSEKMINRKFRL